MTRLCQFIAHLNNKVSWFQALLFGREFSSNLILKKFTEGFPDVYEKGEPCNLTIQMCYKLAKSHHFLHFPQKWLSEEKITSKATVNDARYKVSRILKLVEIVEIKVYCHFYFYYALVGLYSANFFC